MAGPPRNWNSQMSASTTSLRYRWRWLSTGCRQASPRSRNLLSLRHPLSTRPSPRRRPRHTRLVQEIIPGEPVAAAVLPEEEPSGVAAATEAMVETPAATNAAEPLPLEENAPSVIETPAAVTLAEPATPAQAPHHVAEPIPPAQPVEPSVQPSPEPAATAPVIVTSVEPVVAPSPPAAPPYPTPQVVTSVPADPTVAPRRSWNPFRRHEDKPR